MEKNEARVVRVEKENQDIASIYFEGYDDSFRKRSAGSFLTLKIREDGEWSKPHPFTISCAPEDELLRVSMKRLGPFTTKAHGLEPGDRVICSGPYGMFCKGIDSLDNILLVAGGVGITPFLSVLRHFRNIKARSSVLLIWSNKSLDEAFALDELKQMTGVIPLKVVHALSRVPDGTDMKAYEDRDFPGVVFESGRSSRDLMKKHLAPGSPAVFLCGPPPMQDFVIGELQALGVDAGSVKKENFTWKGGK